MLPPTRCTESVVNRVVTSAPVSPSAREPSSNPQADATTAISKKANRATTAGHRMAREQRRASITALERLNSGES